MHFLSFFFRDSVQCDPHSLFKGIQFHYSVFKETLLKIATFGHELFLSSLQHPGGGLLANLFHVHLVRT